MADDITAMVKREVRAVIRQHMPGHRFGLVQQYNPTTHQVQVIFPEDLDANGNPQLSPWMPIIAPASSAGAGDVQAPQMGSQAIVLHFGYGADRFTFMLGTVRAATDTVPVMPAPSGSPPNVGTPEGDRAIVHPTGGQGIYLRGDGIVLAGASDGTFQRMATEAFVLNIFNNHTHGGVQSGGSTTTAPTTTVSNTDTTNLTAQLKGT
jgi:hypothetical protein